MLKINDFLDVSLLPTVAESDSLAKASEGVNYFVSNCLPKKYHFATPVRFSLMRARPSSNVTPPDARERQNAYLATPQAIGNSNMSRVWMIPNAYTLSLSDLISS